MKNTKRIIAIILCLAMAFCLTSCKKAKEPEKTTETTTVAKPSNFNPLTGETDFNKDYIGKRPIGITIQNSEPRCRPQWGLCSPDIVIEGEVEGTATKYIWLFADSSKVEKAGPFRSVRRDFVELAMGFDAILVHCGWSSGTPIGACEYLSSTGYDHIDGVCKWGSVAPNGAADSFSGDYLNQVVVRSGAYSRTSRSYIAHTQIKNSLKAQSRIATSVQTQRLNTSIHSLSMTRQQNLLTATATASHSELVTTTQNSHSKMVLTTAHTQAHQ